MFGTPGRKAVEDRLPVLKKEHGVRFCVVNGENVADGAGITPRLAERLLAAGADVLTLGNHVWRRREIAPFLETAQRVVRPANLASGTPGRGLAVAEAEDGTRVAVLNLQGQLFMQTHVSPFEVVDELVEQARAAAKIVLVDFHAEATSEKVAMARILDGRVTAVFGTHTHVQTSDARVQPGGTAAITDAGMTGPSWRCGRSGGGARGWASASSPRTAACESRARSSRATPTAARSAARPCAFRCREHDEHRHQHDVASKQHPRGELVEVDEVEVTDREPDLRQHQRKCEQP